MGNEGDRDRLTGAGSTGTVTKLPAVDTMAGTGVKVDGRNAQGEDRGTPSIIRKNPRLAESAMSARGANDVPGQSPESDDFGAIYNQSSAYLATHPASVGFAATRLTEVNNLKKPRIVSIGKGLQYSGAAHTSHGPVSMPLGHGRAFKVVSFKETADRARAMVSNWKDTILPMTKPPAGEHQDNTVDSNNFHTSAKAGRVRRGI